MKLLSFQHHVHTYDQPLIRNRYHDREHSTGLTLFVDDAGAFAEEAAARGIDVEGPVYQDGQKIYAISGPDRNLITIQSSYE